MHETPVEESLEELKCLCKVEIIELSGGSHNGDRSQRSRLRLSAGDVGAETTFKVFLWKQNDAHTPTLFSCCFCANPPAAVEVRDRAIEEVESSSENMLRMCGASWYASSCRIIIPVLLKGPGKTSFNLKSNLQQTIPSHTLGQNTDLSILGLRGSVQSGNETEI